MRTYICKKKRQSFKLLCRKWLVFDEINFLILKHFCLSFQNKHDFNSIFTLVTLSFLNFVCSAFVCTSMYLISWPLYSCIYKIISFVSQSKRPKLLGKPSNDLPLSLFNQHIVPFSQFIILPSCCHHTRAFLKKKTDSNK